MIKTEIPIKYGSGVKFTRYRVDWTDVKAIGAATSGNVALFTLPAYSIPLAIIVKHTAVFAGVTGTFKVSVGTSGTATQFTNATADLVATAVADATFQRTNDPSAGTVAETAVVLNCVSTVGNMSALTAGSVDIYVLTAEPTTPLP